MGSSEPDRPDKATEIDLDLFDVDLEVWGFLRNDELPELMKLKTRLGRSKSDEQLCPKPGLLVGGLW
jgi:hypothetical protein